MCGAVGHVVVLVTDKSQSEIYGTWCNSGEIQGRNQFGSSERFHVALLEDEYHQDPAS